MRTAAHALAFFALATSVIVRAQQPATPANLIPLTAASFAAQPERYAGQTVAIYATMDQAMTATVFMVDQNPKASGAGQVLVIAPNLSKAPAAGEYLTIVGEALLFDPAVIATKAKGYRLDIDPSTLTRHLGKPAVLATAVVDKAMTDLAKYVPPPMTPEEEAFDAVMKQVNPTFGDLRKALDAKDAAGAKKHGEALRGFFTSTQQFFAARKTADAQQWAGEAATHVQTALTGAAAGNWPAAVEAAGKIQPLCQTCHTAHRDRLEDGSYRVKRAS